MSTPQTPAQPRGRGRKRIWLAVRLAVAAAALLWTLSRVSLDEMLQSASRVTPWAAAGAIALNFLNLGIGALRWKILLRAYGSRHSPSVPFLARVYLVGMFYNTFLPGNVVGDALRAHTTRRAFDGAAGSYLIVAIERVFGLAGLLTLGASVLAVHPIGGIAHLPELAACALGLALLAAASPLIGRRLARWLPRRIASIAEKLPPVTTPSLLVVVLALSVCTQTVVALTGHLLVSSIQPAVALGDSLVLVPLALIAVYFPITVAGLGVREAAFVLLFTGVGVDRADATAASLAFLAAQLVVALAGGLAHVLWPLDAPEDDSR